MPIAARLRLSIMTTASAAVIYHKCSSYLEKSDFDQYVSRLDSWKNRVFGFFNKTLAATSLSLASKYEEQHVKIRDLINVTYRSVRFSV